MQHLPETSQATIIDNDAEAGTPVVSVNDYVIDESAKVARFVITLDKPSTSVLSLNYATQNGSAEAGTDFVASSGKLSFAPGETAKTVTVTLLNDTLTETAESFNLLLSNLVGANALDLAGTVIIAANDKTPVALSALSVNDIVVGESQTYADFTISLDAPNKDTVTVSYQTQNGTAIFNNDGVSTSGKLTFAPGEVVKTVRVTLVNDSNAEVSENFSMLLFSPSSNATIVRNFGLATIIDNDADTGVPIASISDLVLDEAGGLASFAVTLDKPSPSVVSMNFTTQNGSAKAGSDFTNTSCALTFAPGETVKTITVFLQNDNLAENDEDFSVVLSNLSGATALDPTGNAIIAANDATSVAKSNILIDDIVVGESQTYAEFTIRLDAPNTGIVTVNYSTSNGTAIFNFDAISVNNALTFLPGETVKTVLVTLVNDTAQEITENFSLQLFNASANATIAKNVATATIIDNDAASGTPTVSINDYIIDESTREARFVITLDKPSTQVVSLDYATQNISAKAGEDFVASSGSLSFAPGETVKTVSVALINDAVFEIAESFNLVLSNLVNATALDLVGTVVIAENDAPAVAASTISVDDIVVGESQTFADFEVRLSAPNTDLVKVSYQTQNGSAIFNNDGVGVSGVLNFAPGETVKIVRVLLNNDTLVEPAENFSLILFTPSSNATIVKSEATATIIDNDAVSGMPLGVISDVVLDETARTAQFVVTLDKPSTGVVSMAYATEDGSAKAGADYVAQSGVIHFTPGETAKTVTVFLNNDTVNEIDESFNLVLSEFSGVTMLDKIGTAIIAANDSPAITQSNISVESITVDEGETYATFVVRLDQPNNSTITVNYSTVNGTTVFNFDALSENSQLVFSPGETVKNIAIKLIDDDSIEAIESFSLQLFNPSANATISKSATAIATIIDNDAVSGTPVLSFSDTVIDETTGLIYLSASLDKPSTATVSADFILQNATADGGDYFSYPSVIAFAPGEVVKRVAIGINNDSLAETTEVFNIAVINVTGATLSANGLAQVAIYDNDKTPVASSTISMSNVIVVEDQGYAEVLVTLDAPNTDTVTVSYQTSNGSAIFNNDGIASSGKLTFAPGDTAKITRIILTDDILTEATENFTVSLFTASANATIATTSATVTIVDDDSTAPATAVVLTGTDQTDVLTSTRFQDDISAAAGDDVLNGGFSADTMIGGTGNDTYIVDNSGDTVTERTNEGDDTVISSISYSLGNQLENLVLIGVSAINGSGNSLDNKITGNDKANALSGVSGADTMIGGLGNDVYQVNSANDVVVETSTLVDEIDQVTSTISYQLGANVENLVLTGAAAINGTGNQLNNKITGNDAVNQLDGGLGADTMIGGLGNDVYTVNDIGDVTTESSTSGTEIDLINSSITLTLVANIENLTLIGASALNGFGNELNNVLTGNTAANTLDGKTGIDTMIGGLGNDSYVVDKTGDVVTETSTLVSEVDQVFSAVSFSLGANLEQLTLTGNSAINGTGNELKNRLTGNNGANVLDGGLGVDTMVGGLGNDTYKVDNANDVVTETSNIVSDIDLVQSSVTFTLGLNVENLTLTGSNPINGNGNALNNKITGNQADNKLTGGIGADTLTGDLGNDTYVIDDSADVIFETSSLAMEIDTVISAISFSLANNLENLTLTGAQPINGIGNAAANVITGNNAENSLNGGAGADTLSGGLGNDSYFIDQSGDVIIEDSTLNTEIDTVSSLIDFTLAANLENLILLGSNAIGGIGNSAGNQITGNAGANQLDGKSGNDTLQGGLGDDKYFIDATGDKIKEDLNAGIDSVFSSVSLVLPANVEILTLSGAKSLNGTGNVLNNTLTGNNASNKLSGAEGADTMIGGLGKDTYTVDNASDVVTETSTLATEIDSVNSIVTFSLSANVEKLTLLGQEAIKGTGNNLNNTISGNAKANTISGLSGKDSLTGGNDADIIIGGLDQDTINLTESVASTDTVKIAAGDSLSTGFDVVNGFKLGIGSASTTGVDKLDLNAKSIAVDSAAVNGVDKGIIKSHQIQNGIIRFDDDDNFTSALTLTQNNVSTVVDYLIANIVNNGSTVVVNIANDAYVFQDGGAKDTLVQLTGVTVDSISNTGLSADALWLV